MRSHELLPAIVECLEKALAKYPFPDPSGKDVPPRVFLHGLPDDQGDSAYPFVCVRWTDGEWEEADAMAGGTETVALVLGVFAPESQEQAGKLLAILIDACAATIRRTRILAKKFERQMPIRAAVPDPERRWNQYHMATITTVWQYAIPVTPLWENGKSIHKIN